MVFQHYALFPHMPVEENVAFGLEARGVNKVDRLIQARAALASVGLEGAGSRPIQSLSGGEQQRVALARAIVNGPAIILADEPTGNLDTENSQIVLDMFRELNEKFNQTIIMITHNPEAAAACSRTIQMRDGHIVN